MERLTAKHWQNLDPWECCGQDNFCKRGCHEDGGCNKGCIVPKLYDRLAAYEDFTEKWKLTIDEMDVVFRRVNALGGTDLMTQYKAVGTPDQFRILKEANEVLVARDTAMVCSIRTTNRGIDVFGEYDIDSDFICPSCGFVVGDAEENELHGTFCDNCGQRLSAPAEED